MVFSLSTIVFVNIIGQCMAHGSTAVINTTTGRVQGEIFTSVHSTEYASFKGIRFAEPPLGYLRFKPPVPIEPWTDVLNATVDGSKCPQFGGSDMKVVGSEDCLFLNVYTPVTNLSETPTELKTVMVWIYGGAFVFGSAATTNNRPDFFVEKDVVLVSLNYRLGALGFLNLDHPNATGNAGLKDQNLALKWVQANIEKFGGNPKNVTIFGESAGAVSVGFQVLSEKSAGLFHGAISMSGTPLVPWGFTKRSLAVQRAEKLARFLGAFPWTKTHYLKALYAATAEELVEKTFLVDPLLPFTPSLEDSSISKDPFISDCSLHHYRLGNFNKVPQLLGFMDQETVTVVNSVTEFLALVDRAQGLNSLVSIDTSETLPRAALEAELKRQKAPNSDSSGQFEADPQGSNILVDAATSLIAIAINLTTNSLFKLQIDQTQKLLVDNIGNAPVYYYDTTFYDRESRDGTKGNHLFPGAGHADDVAFVFYKPANNYNLSLSDPMGRTIYRVSTMWTNFAKYGDPTPHWVDQYPLNVTWLPSGKSGQALQIGEELKMVPRPIDSSTKLLGSLLEPLSPEFNDCFRLNIL